VIESKEMIIRIDGKEYRVTENLGFQGGYQARAVQTPEGEKIAVKSAGGWRWWLAREKVAAGAPLRNGQK